MEGHTLVVEHRVDVKRRSDTAAQAISLSKAYVLPQNETLTFGISHVKLYQMEIGLMWRPRAPTLDPVSVPHAPSK